MLQPIVELDRLDSFSPRPHGIAVHDGTVYISCVSTRAIDVIDGATWKKSGELRPPGMAWGLTYGRGELIATCAETDEDIRRVRTFDPHGGWSNGFIPCPEDTGSHLGVYKGHVLLGQWYNKSLFLLDDEGNVLHHYDAPHGVAGLTVRGDDAFLLSTDDEDAGDYWITRLDLTNGASRDIALVPFHARSLFWDGERFWTSYREADKIVRFTLPA